LPHPRDCGPHKTIYNRFVRWSRLGVFNKVFAELARKTGKPRRLLIFSLDRRWRNRSDGAKSIVLDNNT
jgi:transposase